LLVIFLLIFFNDLVRKTHLGIIKREMKEKLNIIELIIKDDPSLILKPKIFNETVANASDIVNLRITVINKKGDVLIDSEVPNVAHMENHLYRVEINNAFSSGWGESIRHSNTVNTDMLYMAKFIDPHVFRVAKPLFEIDENLGKVKKMIILLGFSVVLASLIITIYISNIITRPINATLSFARQFSDGDYTKRILNYSNDEIGMVQRSLNIMADTIVDKIDSLLFEQRKLQTTLESITDGIVVIDNVRKILIANSSFHEMFSIDFAVTNRIYYEVIRSRSLNSKIEYALTGGTQLQFEEKMIKGRILDVSIKPISAEKAMQGILVVLHDITEKKKIEQIKTDLVSNMSHELKTPIAIIKGYLETIEENIENKELSRDFIRKAIINAERQNAIINDILKLNMLETSSDYLVETINVREIIENCVELLKQKAKNKNISITVHNLEALDEPLQASRFLVEEIYFNLIDNALNYTNDNGLVKISAKKQGLNKIVTVSDNGIGIPQNALDRIFERFYRVDKSRSRDTGGTGLGLSIVKHAADLLGWEIMVSSDGAGSTFSITF